VRRVSKTLAAALAVFLLAAGLAACGGGDDSSSTAADAGQSRSESSSNSGTSKQGGMNGSDEGKSSEGKQTGGEGSSGEPSASDFVPKQHNDTGGGSEQYRVKGGDNSVQEFGGEADPEEFDAAAVALHNFLDARAEGNWAAACEYMSKDTVESFKRLAEQAKQTEDTSCGGILERLTNPAAKPAMKAEAVQANVGSLRIEDERAFVIYTGIDGTILAMPMTDENGVWKVASLTGTPLS
jgi:hypothetical protein